MTGVRRQAALLELLKNIPNKALQGSTSTDIYTNARALKLLLAKGL